MATSASRQLHRSTNGCVMPMSRTAIPPPITSARKIISAVLGARLVGEGEGIQHISSRNRDVLFSVHRVADGRSGHGSSGPETPQKFSSPGVQGDEISAGRGAEQDSARGGQDSVAQRALKNLVIPHRPSSGRIERFDSHGSLFVLEALHAAAPKNFARLIFGRRADEA